MSKIVDGQWNLFSDNQVSDADKVADNIYKPGTGYSSLEHINGHLDDQNLPGTADAEYWQITGDVVQDNTFTGGSMVGCTGNVDFFRNPLFNDTWRSKIFGPDEEIDLDKNSDNEDNRLKVNDRFVAQSEDFVPVPGANIEFYLPYDCTLVLITWNVHFDDDGDQGSKGAETGYGTYSSAPNSLESRAASGTRTWLRLYIDDAWVEGQERISFPTKTGPYRKTAILPENRLLFVPGGALMQGRYWNGHHAAAVSNGTGLTKGWHSAGLRIYSNSNQARVRVRGIRHVFFR